MGKFSKEFLFRECVLHRHCILLRLYKQMQWDDVTVDEIYMVDMCLTDIEKARLVLNIANSIDSYGAICIKAFSGSENPHNARVISIPTNDIMEIEFIKK